jgi:ribosomal protein S18 acetylase RimI-like enzyme
MIREARPDEHAAVGELRVAAYRALGLLPEGSGYAQTLRGFGFTGGCVVLVAAGGTGSGILGTVTLEPFGPASELARDETEADVRAFAVAPQAQGQGIGRMLLLAVIGRAGKRGVRRLRLCTQPAMKAAQHLYRGTGFSRTPDLDFEPAPGITLRAYELALPATPLAGQQPDRQPVPGPPAILRSPDA